MQTLTNSTRGLGLIVNMNWDRFMFVGAIAIALLCASQMGHFMVPEGF